MSPSLLQIILLGIVQGAAELLPVSSSAHVIAAEKLMKLDPSSPEMSFLLVMLHTGTMFAVVVYFFGAWRRSFFSSGTQFGSALLRLGTASVATALVGIPLLKAIEHVTHQPIEGLFSNLNLIGLCLAASGVLITWAGLRPRTPQPGVEWPPSGAIWMGAVQGLVLPFRGLSRSGTTISTGMLRGVPRRVAEEFSFALAVVITPPAIARELMRFYKDRTGAAGPVHVGALLAPGLVGLACSFLAGLLALRWLSAWLEKGRWHYFGVYCFAAAAGIFAMAALGY